jgi:hypothetical protein
MTITKDDLRSKMLRSTTQGHGTSEVARGEQIVKNKKSSHASFVQEDVLLHEGMMMFLEDMVLEFMKKEVSEF